jgi:hypothetical protein
MDAQLESELHQLSHAASNDAEIQCRHDIIAELYASLIFLDIVCNRCRRRFDPLGAAQCGIGQTAFKSRQEK